MVEAARDGAAAPVDHQRAPEHEQVVEVEHAERALARRVAAEQPHERVGVLGAPREVLVEHLAQRPLRVDGARVDVDQGRLAREAPRALGVPVLLAHEVEHVGRIARVEQGEVGREAQRGRVLAHEPVRDRVERASEHAARAPAGRAARARSTISRAALRVNVSSRIRSCGTPRSTRRATRAHSVVVLPVPAPASTSRCPPS